MMCWKPTLYPSDGGQVAFGELRERGSSVEVLGRNTFLKVFHQLPQQRTTEKED